MVIEGGSAAARRLGPRSGASLRGTLIGLVLACLLPGMAGTAALLYATYQDERALLERDTIQTARALVQAVDADLATAEAVAQAVAASSHLAKGDLAAFQAQAAELIRGVPIGSNFVLSDVSGQQLVNTVRPFGTPLPRHGNPEQLRRVFDTGRAVVSDIYVGAVLRRPVMSIDVPVMRDGRVIYDLSIGMFPERFQALLLAQQLPEGWVAAVFDRQGTVAARTHLPERFVGGKGAPALVRRMAQVREGIVETTTLEGIPVVSLFSRSGRSGWSVAIGIPRQIFAADLQRRFAFLAATILVPVAVGVGIATFFAERIGKSIRALIPPALALGSGQPAVVPKVRLSEAAEVAAAIGTAAALLARRARELDAANRELQQFSYSVSHDLNAPLRAIAGYAQIVEDEHAAGLDGEARRLLGCVRSNALRMGLLIDGLTEFIRISQRTLHPVRVDVAELARDAFAKLGARAQERRIELRVRPMPAAWADRALLRRAIEHLIDNAVKFIPAGAAGCIEISGEAGGHECVYHVADTGVGFDDRYADKLFQVFERVHAPGEVDGAGVGLAIVKRIFGRHGGRVWAEGRVGRGAIFHFALPNLPTDAPA